MVLWSEEHTNYQVNLNILCWFQSQSTPLLNLLSLNLIQSNQIYHEGSVLHFLHTDSALSLGLAVPGAARKKQVCLITQIDFPSNDG